jgi:hypothetical protein
MVLWAIGRKWNLMKRLERGEMKQVPLQLSAGGFWGLHPALHRHVLLSQPIPLSHSSPGSRIPFPQFRAIKDDQNAFLMNFILSNKWWTILMNDVYHHTCRLKIDTFHSNSCYIGKNPEDWNSWNHWHYQHKYLDRVDIHWCLKREVWIIEKKRVKIVYWIDISQRKMLVNVFIPTQR